MLQTTRITHCLCDVERAAGDRGAATAEEEAEVAGSSNKDEAAGDPCEGRLLEALGQVRVGCVQCQRIILQANEKTIP